MGLPEMFLQSSDLLSQAHRLQLHNCGAGNQHPLFPFQVERAVFLEAKKIVLNILASYRSLYPIRSQH